MFPGAGARVYRNEAGEPIGWDYDGEAIYDPPYLPFEEQEDDAEYCDDCGEPFDKEGACMCEDSAVEEDPDAPIDGRPVESTDPL